MSLEKILPQLEALKKSGKKIISTNGCFDILHRGHVNYLQAARSLGDILIVGINSDASVKKLKGDGRPLNKAEDRAYVLSALRCVDFVFTFNEDLPVEFLKKIKPHTHVKGGDYVAHKLPEYETLKSFGAEIAIIPFVWGYSTTQLLELVRKS